MIKKTHKANILITEMLKSDNEDIWIELELSYGHFETETDARDAARASNVRVVQLGEEKEKSLIVEILDYKLFTTLPMYVIKQGNCLLKKMDNEKNQTIDKEFSLKDFLKYFSVDYQMKIVNLSSADKLYKNRNTYATRQQ